MKTQHKNFAKEFNSVSKEYSGGSQKQTLFPGWYDMYVSGETFIALKPLFSKSIPKYKSPRCL
jgi:hypothetical protein